MDRYLLKRAWKACRCSGCPALERLEHLWEFRLRLGQVLTFAVE